MNSPSSSISTNSTSSPGEIEVRRDDGPDVSAPVVEMDIVGDAERAPPSDVADNPNSREGISNQTCFNTRRNDDPDSIYMHRPPSIISSVSGLYRT
jgi:hypothetical protein